MRTWIAYALLQVQELEAALFNYLVLTRNHAPEQAELEAAAWFEAREPSDLGLSTATRSLGSSNEDLDTRFTASLPNVTGSFTEAYTKARLRWRWPNADNRSFDG